MKKVQLMGLATFLVVGTGCASSASPRPVSVASLLDSVALLESVEDLRGAGRSDGHVLFVLKGAPDSTTIVSLLESTLPPPVAASVSEAVQDAVFRSPRVEFGRSATALAVTLGTSV